MWIQQILVPSRSGSEHISVDEDGENYDEKGFRGALIRTFLEHDEPV
jgi:hypothetical protein